MRTGAITGWSALFAVGGLLGAAAIVAGQARPAAPSAPAAPATKPATRPMARAVTPPTVDSAVAALVAEANERFVPDTKLQITLVRPHRAVAALPVTDAPKVLAAMKQKLTGDSLKDVYIRYHLMEVVNRALATAPEPFTAELLALAPMVPDDIEIELKEWWAYDPPEIGKRYRHLIDSCALSIGFPPFRRRVDAPESFQYMDAATRKKAEAMYAEAKSLEGKFKSTQSQENHVYNYKIIWMNWLIRQYRGELLYAMVAQGDKNALDLITDAVVDTSSRNPIRAADLISFLNAAYFNGYMGKYDDVSLKRVAGKLRSAAAASERAAADAAKRGQTLKGFRSPGQGPTMSTGWINAGGRWRQVPESLFTIVFGIENSRVPKPIEAGKMDRPSVVMLPPEKQSANWQPAPGRHMAEPATKPSTTQPVAAQEVTLDLIDAAIARAIPALEGYRQPDVDLNWCSYVAKRLPSNYWYSDYTLPGQAALTTWAMLASGEPFKDPWFQRRIGWVQCYDSPNTYDRAMRLMLLSNLRYQGMDPWIKRDAAWLIDTMTGQGNWEARNVGVRSNDFGDNANGQYAVLGLWAADQAGVEIPMTTWQKVDNYWRLAQRPAGAPEAGAWMVTSTAALQKGANLNAFANRVSAPMTAGGVLSLHIAEMYLYGPKRVDVGQTLSPQVLAGVDWLDQKFSMDELDGDQDFYYYMWTIQNVGQATGFRTFNNIDWFREVTARLLNTQQPDGMWKGPKGAHVSTSFALLYLARARGPLAVCKVRFDPTPTAAATAKPDAKKRVSAKDLAKANAWNNRPNDLYNFVMDLSRQLEVPTNWQIADLDQSVYELIESPVLYLATDKAFKLSQEQTDRLTQYVDAGGTLVLAPEGRNLTAALGSMKALASAMLPGQEPKRITDNNHPYFGLNGKIKTPIPVNIYGSPTRPKVVIVEKDISRDLQANSAKERDAFTFLMNVYLYAAGKDPARPRIVTNYLTQKNQTPKTKLAVARIKTNQPEGEAITMSQLKAFMADRNDVDLDVSDLPPESLAGSPAKVAFLTVTPSTSLTTEQGDAMRKWVDDGGTLWIDALAGSSAALDKLESVIGSLKLTSGELKPMADHPIVTGEGLYRGYDAADAKPLRLYRNERNDRVTLTGYFVGGASAASDSSTAAGGESPVTQPAVATPSAVPTQPAATPAAAASAPVEPAPTPVAAAPAPVAAPATAPQAEAAESTQPAEGAAPTVASNWLPGTETPATKPAAKPKAPTAPATKPLAVAATRPATAPVVVTPPPPPPPRAAIIVCRGDIMTGVAGMNHWGIAGYNPATSRELVANTLLQFVPPPPKPPATLPATAPATRPVR